VGENVQPKIAGPWIGRFQRVDRLDLPVCLDDNEIDRLEAPLLRTAGRAQVEGDDVPEASYPNWLWFFGIPGLENAQQPVSIGSVDRIPLARRRRVVVPQWQQEIDGRRVEGAEVGVGLQGVRTKVDHREDAAPQVACLTEKGERPLNGIEGRMAAVVEPV